MELYERICEYCRRVVDVGEATIDNGMYYHDSCFTGEVGKRLKKLDVKKHSGQLTMQEAQEMIELTTLIQNIKISSNANIKLSPKLSAPEDPKKAVWLGSACEKLGLSGKYTPQKTQINPQINQGQNKQIIGTIKTKKRRPLISQREQAFRSNSDAAQKRLEAARAERWAWEAMTMIELQLALSWKEQFQITDGKT